MPTEIRRASSPTDYEAAARLLAAMRDWDAAQLVGLGLDPSEVLATYYGRLDASSLAEDHGHPSSGLLLGRVDGPQPG